METLTRSLRRAGLLALLLLAAGVRAQELDPNDPMVLRQKLLARMHAEIDAAATRAHLKARLLVDEVMPIPYLGIDADADGGGMRVTKVLPATGAAEAGLQVGDTILSLADQATPSAAALGRAIRQGRAGDRVPVRVVRSGEERVLQAVLGIRPEEDEDEAEQFPELAAPEAEPPGPVALPFRLEDAGRPAEGLEGVLAGHGAPGRWIVLAEEGNAFLRQAEADRTGIRFPIALLKEGARADAVVRVRIRYFAGDQDRTGGIVLRYHDAGNYLVARINAVERDLRIFRVVHGMRRTLPGARVEIPPGDEAWHLLEFRAEGPKVTATLDGTLTASSYDTYLRAGRTGLWTKSDSVTDFDDLAVSAP